MVSKLRLFLLVSLPLLTVYLVVVSFMESRCVKRQQDQLRERTRHENAAPGAAATSAGAGAAGGAAAAAAAAAAINVTMADYVLARSAAAARRSLLRQGTGRDAAATAATTSPTEIPRVIYQTYHHPSWVPPKVAANLAQYAKGYRRVVWDDDACLAFLREYYHPAVVNTFLDLARGAHKADLFRYAVLYVKGGVYMDIKTQLLIPLEDIFPPRPPGDRPVTYTAIASNSFQTDKESDGKGMIYQGILASPPGNPLFLHAIRTFVEARKPLADYSDYFISTKNVYALIANDTRTTHERLRGGLNVGHGVLRAAALAAGGRNGNNNASPPQPQPPPPPLVFDYFLLEEKFRPIEECPDGEDRYGACVYIYRGTERIIKGRYSDYPFKHPFNRFVKRYLWRFFPSGHLPVLATKEREGALCRALGWRGVQ